MLVCRCGMFFRSPYQQVKKSNVVFKALAKRCLSQSYYDILKVPHNCSSKDVKDAFIALSKKNHPDKHGNDPSMHEKFVRINEAYSVLINPSTRRSYDMTIGSERKLNAPHVYTTRPSYSYSKPNNRAKKQSSSSSNYSSSGTSSNDYFYSSWQNNDKSHDSKGGDYYGLKGVKKLPNSKILLVVVAFTLVGGIAQWFVIRTYSKMARDKMMQDSHRLGLIHAMAREKARLYGNEYQINILKNTLKTTYDLADNEASVASSKEPELLHSNQTCDVCLKSKKL